MRGNCYVASEALFHLLGGKQAGWTPMHLRHEQESHWFLQHDTGLIVDPTAGQFKSTPMYSKARGTGFLTNYPSKRASVLMERIMWQQL